jgi:cold shock CspA family protein
MHRLGVGALRRCSSAGAASGHRNGGGTVRWWKSRKGFGFITADDPTQDAILEHYGVPKDIFAHYRDLMEPPTSGFREERFAVLRRGARVAFVLEMNDKGPRARDVVGKRTTDPRQEDPVLDLSFLDGPSEAGRGAG